MTGPPQIIALGGGGFSDEIERPALDRYVLNQVAAERPGICFIPTASGDAELYLLNFYRAFSRYDCRPSHLPLFGRTPALRETVMAQDVIYVGGGNTRSMLAVWREWGLDRLLREAWEAGILLAGISAGAICWFAQGVTDSAATGLGPLDGLALIEGSCCPHYSGDPERRPAYHRLIQHGEIAPGYALDDGAAVHLRGQELLRAVASRPAARVYRVEAGADGVVERPLPTHLLNDAGRFGG